MRGFQFAAIFVALAIAPGALGGQAPSPFEFFSPAVRLDPGDLRALGRGEPIVRTLPGHEKQVAVFGAISLDAPGDRLVAWVGAIERFKQGPMVRAVGRFSDPARAADLERFTLTDAERSDLRGCRVEDCSVKLTAEQIEALHRAREGTAEWEARADDLMRRLLVERVTRYRASGLAALGAYADRDPPRDPAAAFADILDQSAFLRDRLPEVLPYLQRRVPNTLTPPVVASFVYWSQELFGGRPVASGTDVWVFTFDPVSRPGVPETLVLGKQIFATHYLNGSLNLTAVVRDPTTGQRYLAFLNRSEVDVIGGFFGGLARRLVERRIRGEADDILRGLKSRLEGGLPD